MYDEPTEARGQRGAIALYGGVLLAITSMACASTGHVPRPFPGPEGPRRTGELEAPPGRPKSRDLLPVVATALGLQGTPYRNGGADPMGFDCSGFTQYVFAQQGMALPRETRDQFRTGRPVRKAEVGPGDLVFFSTIAPGASHVAIALDDDQFVHAPSSTGVVRIERMSLPYWERRFVGARRLRPALDTR